MPIEPPLCGEPSQPYDLGQVILDTEPLAGLPDELFLELGRFVAWCAYIEYDLFVLYCVFERENQSPVQSRERFYKVARGLGGRLKLLKGSVKGKMSPAD